MSGDGGRGIGPRTPADKSKSVDGQVSYRDVLLLAPGIPRILHPQILKWKWKYLSGVQLFVTIVHGILPARILEWVAFPFSRGSSQPRVWTQGSHIAGGFFTSWATRETQEVVGSVPSLADLPNPGIKTGSPALQVDSLPTELSGNPHRY